MRPQMAARPLHLFEAGVVTETRFAGMAAAPGALSEHFVRRLGPDKHVRVPFNPRDRWVSAVRGNERVNVLTPDDPHLVGAITSFRLRGRGDAASNPAITKSLLDEFGIFTFARTGLAKGDCVRVTPALYNSAADVDKLAEALTKIAAR